MKDQLPNGWCYTELGKIIEPSKEKVNPDDIERTIYIGLEHIEKQKGIINGNGYSDEVHSTKSVFRKGDLLYGKLRPYLNKVTYADTDGICSTDILVFPKKYDVNNKLIKYFLMNNEFVKYANKNVSGVQHPRVNFQTISNYKIGLPPFKEQARIVSKIEELLTRLDAGIKSLKQVQILLKKYRQSVLKSAVEGKLTSEWRKQHKDELEPGDKLLERILKERKEKWEAEQLANFKAKGIKPPKDWKDKYKEPSPPDTSKLPELPDGWVWVSLDQIKGESQIGLVKSKREQNSEGNGFTYLKMNNVTTDGRVLFDDVVFVAATREEGERYLIKRNDILFNTRNSKELVGKTGLVRVEKKNAIYNNNLMRIRTINSVKPDFILQQICDLSFKERMENIKRATTNVAAIYAKDLMPLPLAMPSEKEQAKIMSLVDHQFSVIEKLDDEIKKRLIHSQSLRQSILKKAFEGKLVLQDPNDEPASVLLERIKAEKSKLKN